MTKTFKPAQSLWAVIDPNWGNPVIIPETVRTGQDAAKDAFLWFHDYCIYHGGSQVVVPEKKGNWKRAEDYGFYVVKIQDFTAIDYRDTKETSE